MGLAPWLTGAAPVSLPAAIASSRLHASTRAHILSLPRQLFPPPLGFIPPLHAHVCLSCSLFWLRRFRAPCGSLGIIFFFFPLEMSVCPLKHHITWAGSQEPVRSHAQPSVPAHCPSLPCPGSAPRATSVPQATGAAHRALPVLQHQVQAWRVHVYRASGLGTPEPVCLHDATELPSPRHGHPEPHAVCKGCPGGELGGRRTCSCLPGLTEPLCKGLVPRT